MEKQVDVRITISDDYYKAYLYVTVFDGRIKLSDLHEELKAKNIVFGVKNSVLEKVVNDNVSVAEVLIAEGMPHVLGEDAKINLHFDVTKDSKPVVLEDGRVDFKEVGFVRQVKAGDILATKTPAKAGVSGVTVTGKTIRAKDGRDKVLRFGKNVELSEDGLTLTATVDGSIMLEGEKVSVHQLLEIRSDVGITTGNVRFTGNVNVYGNVTTGYQIECEGDLTVNGVVEGAIIKAGGNITITRGIQGMDTCEITCGGNLVSNFISNAKMVSVVGDIESGAIMNSPVYSNGKVIVKGKKGVIVGGEVSAKSYLEANTVGSELGILTSIKLGVDTELLVELNVLTSEVRTLIDEHEKLKKVFDLLKKRIEEGEADPKTFSTFNKVYTQFTELDTTLIEKRQRLKLLNELISSMQDAKVTTKTLYPGVRIKIGHSNYYVKEAISDTTVLKHQGEIVLRSN